MIQVKCMAPIVELYCSDRIAPFCLLVALGCAGCSLCTQTSLVEAHRFSCLTACGILVTGAGIGPLHWNVHSLPLDFQGSPNRIEPLKHQSEFYLAFFSLGCEGQRSEREACVLFFYFWPCHGACEVLVPQPGIEPLPPAVEA